MTIPVSQIVQVNPGVLSATGSAVDLNGLILTRSSYPPIGSVVPFSSPDDVAAYFGGSSAEKALADVYFTGVNNGTRDPGQLLFCQSPEASVSAYLRGGSLASMTLAELRQLTGTLTLLVDGVAKTATTLDLSAVSSFSAAAQALATALGIPVVFDSTQSAFILSSASTGSVSTIDYATGTLAAPLRLTSATGAVKSQGSAAATPTSTMDQVVAVTQNWAAFMTTWEPARAQKNEFSAWTSAKGDRYAYVGWDTDVNAKVANSTNTWGADLISSQASGSIPVFGSAAHAAFVLAWMASLDFSRLNGRSTLAFRAQDGITASVSNATDAANLKANGYNFYGAYATAKENFNFMYPGAISGKWKWADSYANQIWLNASLQAALIRLAQSVGSVPYNADGYALIETALADPVDAAVTFGAIRVGTTLSNSQVAQIRNAVGSDVSQAIIAKGYYIQILPATAGIRVDRASPSISFYYADGGSVQQFTVASIEVQ